jgi:hypothetical protein
MKKIILLLILGVLPLSGCAVKEFSSFKYNVQGEYLLDKGAPSEGTRTFRNAVENDPENARVQYFYGRVVFIYL